MMIHKETFTQPPHQGIPYHVVVQYWDENGDLQAKYFGNYEDAEAFEDELDQSPPPSTQQRQNV